MTRSDMHARARGALGFGLATAIGLCTLSASAQQPTPNGSTRWNSYAVPSPDPVQGEQAAPRLPYREGMPVPEGYHLEETPRYGLIATGVSMTGALWLVSVVSAIALDREASQDGDPNFDDMYWPMFIPVAGPFAAIATADSSGTGAAILALDGTIQAVGLAMTIAGFAAPSVELVPDYQIQVTPIASSEEGGFALSGSF